MVLPRPGYWSEPQYLFDPPTGVWRHAAGLPEPPMSLADLTYQDGAPRFVTRRHGEPLTRLVVDAAKQYLQDERVILPFFTLQEMTTVVQAELTAERKSHVPTDEQKQARLVQFLGYGDWLSVRPEGPLWFRGYDQWSEEEGAAQVGKLLEAYNAAHIAVGHTVQRSGRMRPRFDSKVFLIDTGMLSSYYPGGRASAMEICGDARFTAEYMDQRVVLLDSAVPSAGKAGSGTAAGVQDAAKISENPAVSSAGNGICPATAATPQ